MDIDRIESSGRWFFAFWCDMKDEQGRWLPFPSVSLGFFRIMWDSRDPWAAPRFYFNNDD